MLQHRVTTRSAVSLLSSTISPCYFPLHLLFSVASPCYSSVPLPLRSTEHRGRRPSTIVRSPSGPISAPAPRTRNLLPCLALNLAAGAASELMSSSPRPSQSWIRGICASRLFLPRAPPARLIVSPQGTRRIRRRPRVVRIMLSADASAVRCAVVSDAHARGEGGFVEIGRPPTAAQWPARAGSRGESGRGGQREGSLGAVEKPGFDVVGQVERVLCLPRTFDQTKL